MAQRVPHRFHRGGGHFRGSISPRIPDVGEHRSKVGVAEDEGKSWHLQVVRFAADGDSSAHSMEGDANEAIRWACDPFGPGER